MKAIAFRLKASLNLRSGLKSPLRLTDPGWIPAFAGMTETFVGMTDS